MELKNVGKFQSKPQQIFCRLGLILIPVGLLICSRKLDIDETIYKKNGDVINIGQLTRC